MTRPHSPVAPAPPADYEVLRRMAGCALFVDVRGSSGVVDFVERHHGPEAAAALFMSFLSKCMEQVAGLPVEACVPSGDAVLAIFTGDTRIQDAVTAARRMTEFIRNEFGATNRPYLTCDQQCGDPHCRRSLSFDVGAGIDDGIITVSRLHTSRSCTEEFVGSCVSTASKLSGKVRPPNSIGITLDAYDRGLAASEDSIAWQKRILQIGGIHRKVMLAEPSA